MVVTGDPTQVDLPPGQQSGLAEALSILDDVPGIAVARFDARDVVRHPLVARIVAAYDRAAPGVPFGRAEAAPRNREGARGRAGQERDGTGK